MRKLILAAVAVTALGFGAAAAADTAGINDPARAPGLNTPHLSRTSQSSQNDVSPSTSQILQAQQQLRDLGFYHGTVDGILGAKTKQAIDQYQKENGLKESATLDQATMNSLLESTGVAGSSTPARPNRPMTNPHPGWLGSSRPGGATAPY